MPIPAFDLISSVLPPHRGNPAEPADHSPYECTVLEFCRHFATSPERRAILEGFLKLRQRLLSLNVTGFQWLDGSFLEDVEAHSGRAPRDIDIVTFISTPLGATDFDMLAVSNPWLLDHAHIKTTHRVDHFIVHLGWDPRGLINLSRYWYGLFSHRRDGTWKGMLCVELSNPSDDAGPLRPLELRYERSGISQLSRGATRSTAS